MTIAILGGTGRFGRALGGRLSSLGLEVFLGSRDPARAADAARTVGADGGLANAEAAARADTVVAAVPFRELQSLAELATVLADKVVISPVVPVEFVSGNLQFAKLALGSAAELVASLLPDSKVVSAFHTVSYTLLGDDDTESLDQDILVCGDHADAKHIGMDLVARIQGLRPIDGGPLGFSRAAETMGVELMLLDRMNNANCGITVTGLPR